jgi:toxin ParE1/3/4
MSWRLAFSPEARADMRAIGAYIHAEAGPSMAARYLRDLSARLELLRDMPLTGVMAPEFGDAVRYVPCRRHVLYYEAKDGIVLVLRVLHHAQDRDTIMRGVQEEALAFEISA